ncbi:MAG: hypothetical protein DWQ34_09880 [Planctomycetota bacterium]|nr:MAG: hypothetical protein DWQ34_09880 [Planctomycetota bacterium]REK21142.1 MAG: hypothetical protein DWQ41_22270 [Planctomycetota bacterium]REK29550.1 MAG: hypothetical protein DWQ45_22305 [Planctomycetota bacterium]
MQIEQIVQGVLSQIGTAEDRCADSKSAALPVRSTEQPTRTVRIADRVVTAAAIEDLPKGTVSIDVQSNAIITPAARDVIRETGLAVHAASPSPAPKSSRAALNSLRACIVRHTTELDRVLEDVPTGIERELLGCPDDAASLAISEICRGDADRVVIFAEQTHRAACLANRNEHVKAAAVEDAADVRNVKRQLRANVWCVDPTGRSGFELRNLLTAITE